MFDIINFNLAADVANNGTVTIGYPTGRSKGDYSLNPANHVLFVGQNEYAAPADFTLTFNANASNITLTNVSGATWKQGAACGVQIERAGADDALVLANPIIERGRVTQFMPVALNLGSANVADADGISASQSVTVSTTALALINGALASGGEAVLDVPRNVVAAWTGTAILTVTGEDEYGVVMKESSASGTSLTGKKAFRKITSCSFSANVTGATIGTGEKLGLPIAVRKSGLVIAELKDGVIVGRSPTVTRINWFAEQVSVLAGTSAALELISPITGNISKLGVAVRVAVGTGGNVTVKVGTTDVTGLTVAIANSATKGTTATDTPTTPGDASTVVNKGDRIQIVFDDAFATTGALDGYLEITPTDDLTNGTLVLADGTEATATTGDVRGTYTPADVADGTTGRRLIILTADPNDLGVAQYAG